MIIRGGDVLVPAHLSFSKYILERLRNANPDDTAWVNSTTGESLSYGRLARLVSGASAALRRRGVSRGVSVAVAGEPRAALLPGALAVVLAGAAYTPLELASGRAVVERHLNLSKPGFVVCSRAFRDAYGDILERLEFVQSIIGLEELEEEAGHEGGGVEPRGRGDDVAVVAYSSGTTGACKAMLLTHVNLLAATSNTDFGSMQTFHLSTRLAGLHDIYYTLALWSDARTAVYCETGVDLRTLQDYRVNVVACHPATVQLLSEADTAGYDLSALQAVCTSGDRLHPATTAAFIKRFPNVLLMQSYGSSETGAMTTGVVSAGAAGEAGGGADIVTPIGYVKPGVSLKVVDVETRETLGPNQRGEICVQSPYIMKGYLGGAAHLDEQGFYRTGDLGYYDKDHQFYFVDRIKDVICYNGIKKPPSSSVTGHIDWTFRELYKILRAHPAVRAAAAAGRAARGAGQLPAAFVVLRPGARATEAELQEHVASQVSPHMRLRGGVRFVQELPASDSRKLLRRRLQDLLAAEDADA